MNARTALCAAIIVAALHSASVHAGDPQSGGALGRALAAAAQKRIEQELVNRFGAAIGVGSPLRLDHRTAFPVAVVEGFQPQPLEPHSPEDVTRPIPPGDYSLAVVGYCTEWALHLPGRGLPYKIARMQGRQAEAIGALLFRGTLRAIGPKALNTMAWRIQGGLPLSQWRAGEREIVHQLIPEYEQGLEGDFLQRVRGIYDQAAKAARLPAYEALLARAGEPGQAILELQRARRVLANRTLAVERMPDLLYGRARDGLPRTLTGGPNEPPSAWAEILPGVFARLTIVQGSLGRNVLDVRVTPRARRRLLASEGERFVLLPARQAGESGPAADEFPSLRDWFIYVSGLIAHPEGRPAQTLIIQPMLFGGGIRG